MIDYQASNIINAALSLDLKSAAGLEKFRKVVQSALEEAAQQSAQEYLPCTCPKSGIGFIEVKADDCPAHGR
jgi:hypothetical protein